MRQFNKNLFLLLGVTLFVNCTHKGVITISSFPIEKSVGYSAYEIDSIIDPAVIAVSNNYLFLLGISSDPIFQEYKLNNLDYVQCFGRRGRGPGEFAAPPIMYTARDQEKLYIYYSIDRTFTAYKILENGELELEQKFTVDKSGVYNQFHIIKDSLLVHNLLRGIEKIDLAGGHSSKIEFTKNMNYEGRDFFHPDNGDLSVTNKYIVYAYWYKKQIDIYNIDNLSLKARLLAKGQSEKITSIEQPKRYYYNVYASENYIYACYVDPDSDDEQNKYFVEVFDFNGKPIKRYNIGISLWGMFAVSSDDSAMYSYNWDLERILKFDIADD